MFSSDYVFTTPVSTTKEMVSFLKNNGFNREQTKNCMKYIADMSGAYCITASREIVQDIPTYDDIPHYMKRLPPHIGFSITVVNLADLTPDEELAIWAHEFGHVNCGHLPTDEDQIQCELDADYFAVVTVGAIHVYSALTKLVEKFKLHDDYVVKKRLEKLRQYL